MRAVGQIDKALKTLYNIETELCAEQFLIQQLPSLAHKKVASREFEGALYIQQNPNAVSSEEPTIELGIYLSQGVWRELETFPDWESPWTLDQLKAFSVASEEVSHFHYLVYNLHRKRPVSEFELELQGEIDRFFLLFFCESFGEKTGLKKFEQLFEQLFFNYRLANSLSETQKERYRDASIYAKRFFQKMRKMIAVEAQLTEVLKQTRQFYQMDLAHKMSFIHRSKD